MPGVPVARGSATLRGGDERVPGAMAIAAVAVAAVLRRGVRLALVAARLLLLGRGLRGAPGRVRPLPLVLPQFLDHKSATPSGAPARLLPVPVPAVTVVTVALLLRGLRPL